MADRGPREDGAEILEAGLRQEAELRQETNIRKEAELQYPKVETTEKGEGSGAGVSDEGEAQDEDEDGDEGMTTSGEEINGTDKDAERDDGVYDRDGEINQDNVQGGGNSEAEEWEIGGSDGGKDEKFLWVEDTEEA